MKTVLPKSIRVRALCVGLLFFCVFAAIGARAVHVQIVKGEWWSKKAAVQYQRSYDYIGRRGTIYDAKGGEMAVSSDTTSICAYPNQIEDKNRFSRSLAGVLNHDADQLVSKLNSGKSFVWLKRQSTPSETRTVKSLELSGIGYLPEHKRFYPHRTMAAQVIGFAGLDGTGLEGLEFYYDADLRGTKVSYKVIKDALGRRVDLPKDLTISRGGNHLVLTIDPNIQHIAAKTLQETVEEFSASSGWAVVMEPATGAVLAMAQYPSFNPNTFAEFDRDLWRNRIITDQFEPGSTLKIFTAAAALDSGVSKPRSIYYCEKGAYSIGSNTINDTKPRGWLSLANIIKYSSNIGAVKISEEIGAKSIFETLSRFGFGQKTGIDCPGETAGRLRP